jgi:5-methylcytosine-specific restriction endonuclease McrA|tara:strand:+ start:175 stop:402 length:228 start_codon:yes stop_codon:yes gene_type:complete
MAKKRNYKKEYKDYHSKPIQLKRNAMRNKARSILGLKVGDPREADHIIPLSKGGTNKKSNLRAVSRTANRKKHQK